MTDRFYRLLTGALILAGLYFDLHQLMIGLIGLMIFEGVTGFRLPHLLAYLGIGKAPQPGSVRVMCGSTAAFDIGIDAERAWRLVVAGMLILTYVMFFEALWFFPWFMGFAIFGAGLSGICPVLIFLQLLGFK